jgi:hypothetical protein
MCGETKTCLIIFLSALLFCFVSGAAHPEEQWYLITEPELRSIEEYRKNSEAEKRNWLLQVQNLSRRAGILEAESRSLNSQLQNQRELNRKLTLSFNEYEAAQSLLMSRKDTHIIQLETENKGKDRLILRLIIAAVLLGLGIVIPLAIKIIWRIKSP